MKKSRRYIIIFVVIILVVVLILISNRKVSSTKDNTDNILKDINEVNTNTSTNKNSNILLDNTNQIENSNIVREKEKDNDNLVINEDKEEKMQNNINDKIKKFGSNVAFIGDSRTQGFLMYTGQKEVVDYTYIGLMVDTAITKEFVKTSTGDKITILEDMKNKNIDTIYIMLGINELGWAYSNVFINKYEELVDKIRQEKPNCKIYLQSIIPVTKEKSDRDDIYNNNKIKEYNILIENLANKKGIKYLNVASALADEEGNLPKSASTDGIHINKEYCNKWIKYIQNNS